MSARRAARLLFAVAVLLLSTALSVRATHQPKVEDVVATAEAWSTTMSCAPSLGHQLCDDWEFNQWAVVTPDSGPLTNLQTKTFARFTDWWVLDLEDRQWMEELQNIGCNDAAALSKFMDQVAAMANPDVPDTVSPTSVGECTMSASLGPDRQQCASNPCYRVNSSVEDQSTPVPPTPTPAPPTPTPVPPTPTPTVKPTASPTPTPTPSPTATPTVAPTATPTLAPGQTPGPTPVVTPSAIPTDTQAPTADPTDTATEEPTDTPSPTPEEGVLGGTSTPQPSPPVGAPGEGADQPGGFVRSVPPFGGVSTDPAALGSSLAIALAMLLFMGFIGEMVNNTVEAHYDELMGWFKHGWLRPIGWLLGIGKGGVE